MEWDVISSYFEGQELQRLVNHQIESYNDFVMTQLNKTVTMFNPVMVRSPHFYDKENKQYSLEAMLTFSDVRIGRPQIHENNGAVNVMFPHEARRRNFTYAANVTVSLNITYIHRKGANLEEVHTLHNTLPEVHLGKIPIMLKSRICVLTQNPHLTAEETNECKYEPGGSFIINGSEKLILGQERAAWNTVFCYPSNLGTKVLFQAEIKCVPRDKSISPKQVIMYMMKPAASGFKTIQVQLPRIRKTVPLGVLFKALGIMTDRAICDLVTDQEDIMDELTGTIEEASTCKSQDDALGIMVTCAMFPPSKYDKPGHVQHKKEYLAEVLETDMFPHCHNREQRVALLGYMVNKLLRCSLGRIKCDDRDSGMNKRVDMAGVLLMNNYRTHMFKLVKDAQKKIASEMYTGSWRATNDYLSIVNSTNIGKIIKSSTIENGIKRALATGDFSSMKQSSSSRAGVGQVLNRLTYASTLSHLRRVNTPASDKNGGGKLMAPRKLHSSTWGFMCPAETPEGQSIGIVKNLSILTRVTIQCDPTPIVDIIATRIEKHSTSTRDTKVFVNGAWVGNCANAQSFYRELKQMKHSGIINIYTSIVFDYTDNEIRVCCDAGRLVRPVFNLVGNKRVPFSKPFTWNDLLFSRTTDQPSVIEYIDQAEQNSLLIAMSSTDLGTAHHYTHCEIHPSTIFGVLASCIPFPEHNQSPRNTYQCAMGKQAIGIYSTNYKSRMDKTAYVLPLPQRPLVDTRVMAMLKLNEIPSGMNVVVAIMTHTGYNQEDSIMINEGAIERGLFTIIAYDTEKDEDKKINGDVEVRCKPEPLKTTGIQFGNYDKIASDGLIAENTRLRNMDVIMGKVVPIADARNDPTKVKKYKDLSRCYRTTDEEIYVDKTFVGRSGDGYDIAKVRTRAYRCPKIGDKFSSRHGQKGTVGNIIPEKDMPFTENGLIPDLIINPHAIPSRMTIAQLIETLLGKVAVNLGCFGDGTAFMGMSVDDLKEPLHDAGYESFGNEIMYNGQTGEQIETIVFTGPCYYQRLKHMVIDKINSRSQGPIVSLTRQPTEGRARDGGLRFGEMERDCMLSHGAASFTKGRIYDDSDKFEVNICTVCGMIAVYNDEKGIHICRNCSNKTDFRLAKIPYSCKLLFQELNGMNIAPRLIMRPNVSL
jgi:DNA-directed RNA polymerase II subunit RPB2